MTGWLPWRQAMERALYAPGGFYHRPGGPAAHFRTSVHASPLFAGALLRLARWSGLDTVVDVGAGRGELLAGLYAADPALGLLGVELAERPAGLPATVEWVTRVPARLDGALIVANELLDNVPVDVMEVDEAGAVRLVLVDPVTGAERLGDGVAGRDAAWLERWWPVPGTGPGTRAEVGWPRDELWAQLVGALGAGQRGGVAVAVDYAHRRAERPSVGSLSAYRAGRAVVPVPDGSCDLTAAVALDACAAAGTAAGTAASTAAGTAASTAAGVEAGAVQTLQLTQRAALTALGLAGARPAPMTVGGDPGAYLQSLATAGAAAELLDEGGLGGFGWLIQAVRTPLPARLLAAG